MNINTNRMTDAECISQMPAEACSEIGADGPDTALEALGYLLAYVGVLLAFVGAGALWAWL